MITRIDFYFNLNKSSNAIRKFKTEKRTFMAFTNQTVSINRIMEYFYQVPDYQRGYVWDQERVTDFLESVFEHFSTRTTNNYFIGAAVFESSSDQNKYYVVDGQQRLTTIFVIIAAAFNLLKYHNAKTAIIDSIANSYLSKYNLKEDSIELKIQHSDLKCKEALQSILNNNDQTPDNTSKSAEHIFDAYRTAKTILNEKLNLEKNDDTKSINALLEFIEYFERINLLPFISQSREESLTVFETLNSKGVGLSNLDILKSILFDSIKEDDDKWDELTNLWMAFTDVFEPLKLQANKFLRYVVVTQFLESVPAAKCLQWIKENESTTAYKSNPKSLIQKLTHTASCIKNIREGYGPDKKKNMYLINMRKLSPNAEQQYFMLIPLWEADIKLFDQACAASEAVLFINKILAHYTGSTEKNFIDWGKKLHQHIKNKLEFEDVMNGEIWPILQNEKTKLEATLLKVTWTNTNRNLIRWLLQRCELHAALISTDDVSDGVDKYQNVDIEHIEPQNGSTIDDAIIQGLGNLTIQEKGFNRAYGNRKFEEKLPAYGKSGFKMTNALAGLPVLGGKSKKAYELFYSSSTWGSKEISQRTIKLVEATLISLKLS